MAGVNGVVFHPNGTCMASCSTDSKIKVFDLRANRLIQHYEAHTDAVTSISMHPSGNFLMSASNDGTVKVWDLFGG